MMMAELGLNIEELVRVFQGRQDVIAAYLFGSQAKGTAGSLSDMDVAYLLDDELFEKEMESPNNALYWAIAACLKTDHVSVVCLNEAPLTMRQAIISTGKVLYSSDERKRIEFTEATMREYMDTRPMREEYYRYLLERIKEGGLGDRYSDREMLRKELGTFDIELDVDELERRRRSR